MLVAYKVRRLFLFHTIYGVLTMCGIMKVEEKFGGGRHPEEETV